MKPTHLICLSFSLILGSCSTNQSESQACHVGSEQLGTLKHSSAPTRFTLLSSEPLSTPISGAGQNLTKIIFAQSSSGSQLPFAYIIINLNNATAPIAAFNQNDEQVAESESGKASQSISLIEYYFPDLGVTVNKTRHSIDAYLH